ncbi:MAG: poly-beta-1,6 N-acetyl-D-glucosamine export porin PgaA, partial [Woeseia sp.]
MPPPDCCQKLAEFARSRLQHNMGKSGIYLVLIILGAGLLDSAVAAPDSSAWSREQAIEAARNGDFENALSQLARLREGDPGDMAILHDETVVLSWAGRDKLVVKNAATLNAAAAPDYVLNAVARSARNVGAYGTAADWYRILLERNALNLDARRGLAMTHADAGDFSQAWQVLDALPDSQMRGTSICLTEAYVYERQGRLLDALSRYQLAAELDPDSAEALRGAALIMRKMLLPAEALALAREHPGILTDAEIDNLMADLAAVQLRFGTMAYRPQDERHAGIDAALEMIDTVLAEPGLDPSAAKRLRYDRIAALNNRKRTADAVREFEALEDDPASVPLSVLMAAGGAYLAERRPETARDLFKLALERDPANSRIKFELFFAYTELGEAQRALDLAEDLLASQPKTRRVPGSRVVKANPAYVRAAVLYGLAQAYFDQLAGAQSHLKDLLAKAPNNTDVRHELANVYRWRGWLDKSLYEYDQVLTIEPDLVAARVGRAHATLDNQDYAMVQRELELLTPAFHDEPMVRSLAERWRIHNDQEISTSVEFGKSSGTTFGSDQYTINASWYSSPLARRYRLLAFTRNDFADFPEGSLHRDRVGAGVEFRHKRWLAAARLAGLTTGGGLGMRGNV